jgi:hypothetical protein
MSRFSKRLSRQKGRRSNAAYSQLIHAYFQSPEYARLSHRARALLIDLYCQYRGNNNGDLCATAKVMRPRGWTSNDQLVKAIRELLDAGWIVITRQGGRNQPHLFAVTFWPIDECDGKLDVKATTAPLHTWKRPGESAAPVISLHRHTEQVAPPHGARVAA